MVHLSVAKTESTPHGTACGSRGDGDRRTCRTEQCTCSACEMHIAEHRAYLQSLQVKAMCAPRS